jgi:hypothetical protein
LLGVIRVIRVIRIINLVVAEHVDPRESRLEDDGALEGILCDQHRLPLVLHLHIAC